MANIQIILFDSAWRTVASVQTSACIGRLSMSAIGPLTMVKPFAIQAEEWSNGT